LGTPAATSRGMKEKEMKFIGETMIQVLNLIKKYQLPKDKESRKEYLAKFKKEIRNNKEIKALQTKVKKMALRFPIP
jgi:glycine/serine hydroxymethyltransferase